MVSATAHPITLKGRRSSLSIYTGADTLPIEVSVLGKFPPNAGAYLVANAMGQQQGHPEYVNEYNEPSAIIGKTDFAKNDATAVYTFGVGKKDLVFHRHTGHRAITAITGSSGCLLKFSICSPEELVVAPEKFLSNFYVVQIPGDRLFALRFSGTIYHQFCPLDPTENAFFAISVHTNEAAGLSGTLLETVLANKGNIPLLTEPVPGEVSVLLQGFDAKARAEHIFLDLD